MLKLRHALIATAAAVTLIPAGPVFASISGEQAVRTLATDAAELVAEEAALVAMAGQAATTSSADLAAIEAALSSVDGQGQAVLVQLQGLGVELTPAIETTLDRLPTGVAGTDPSVSLAPQPMLYEAAIDDLFRIADTPAAVAPVGDSSGGASYALLFVAAISLVIMSAAALANTLWRRTGNEQMQALTWSDGVTGLANRRKLDRDLKLAAEAPTSVIMIDVDDFTGISDAYGHEAGDKILKRLGTLLAHHVRLDDVVYRYGGEEFCVLLPGADAVEAGLVANRVLDAARTIDLPNGAHVTVSVGVAGPVETVGSTLQHADRALGLAKEQGRDRAVHADEQELASA